MIRVTIDASTLAPGFVRPDRPPGRLIAAWQAGLFTLVTSDPLIDELADVLANPYFTRAMSPERAQRAISLLRSAEITLLTVVVQRVATHPEDDVVLATALSGGAQFLISSDHRLLDLGSYQGLTIVSASEFLGTLPGLLP